MTHDKTARRTGSIGYAAIALVCAGFAAYLMTTVLRAKGYKQVVKKPALVAARAVPANQKLAKEDVKVVQMEEALVPADAMTSIEQLFPTGKEPPLTATPLVAGDWILPSRLADAKNGTAMAGRVRDGYRAIAVAVDKAVARSRLVFPGAIVDVVGTFRAQSTSFSRKLVEGVRVLSLESQTDVESARNTNANDNEQRKVNDTVVTIEVTPEQAEIVALAAREGEIDLVLRNAGDVAEVDTKGATTNDLLKAKGADLGAAAREDKRSRRRGSSARVAAEPPPAAPGIEVIGGNRDRRR